MNYHVSLSVCLSVSLSKDIGQYILFTSSSLPSLLSSFFLPIFLLLSYFFLSLFVNTHKHIHVSHPFIWLLPYFNFFTSCISTFPSFLLYSLLYLFLTFFPFPLPSVSLSHFLSLSLSLWSYQQSGHSQRLSLHSHARLAVGAFHTALISVALLGNK